MTPHPDRLCGDCHRPFSPKYSYERWCWPCWRERKALKEAQAKNTKAAFDHLWNDYREACCEIWSLKREVEQLSTTNLSLSMRLLEAQSRKAPESDLVVQLRRQMPRLIQALHPDKNSSPASHELTVWLLQLKRQLS